MHNEGVAPMPDPSNANVETAMMLGEMKGQLRELIHQGNNQAMKNDAVARTLAKLETIPDDIAEIKARLTTLEADRHRREAERGMLGMMLRSPLVGWLAGFALALWAWWKGQGHG